MASPADSLGRAFAAYDRADLRGAKEELASLTSTDVVNDDYYWWLTGQVALLSGDAAAAQRAFTQLRKQPSSRFYEVAQHRLADAMWQAGDKKAAGAYQKALALPRAARDTDRGTVMFRLASAQRGAGRKRAMRAWMLAYPKHALEADAVALLGTEPVWTPGERITRARTLTAARRWDEAVVELEAIKGKVPVAVARQRDYWLGTTLFSMRRRYAEASRLLLSVYRDVGEDAASALFHGARALSRSGDDDAAIGWYQRVVAEYPRSTYADEAQYLSGWLEYNRGRYAAAIAPLRETIARFPRSRWADEAAWFIALSHYLMGEWDAAKSAMQVVADREGALSGGKGRYWLARIAQLRSDRAGAIAGYERIMATWPLSWYALLAEARLREMGKSPAPFAGARVDPGPIVGATDTAALRADRLIARVDELLAAGLLIDAGIELERGRQGLMSRHPRTDALGAILRRFESAQNYNRPWMLAEVTAKRALLGPPTGNARIWWQMAYPKAYAALVEPAAAVRNVPSLLLYSIMRKESGFDPHVVSYADAQGLLQMIPPTTRKVTSTMGLVYDEGRLYEPAFNIETGAWYIGSLFAKFRGQVPMVAGSYNAGPRPMMTWLTGFGVRPMDEFVELVPYQQTREYMKKVTENYAKYMLLYGDKSFVVPLTVDRAYVDDELTY